MNLSSNVRLISAYASSGTFLGGSSGGTTGDAVVLSTAAAAGSTTVSPGGYPVATTGFDMRGYEGAVCVATWYSGSTGGGAGTSGIATLQYYAGVSSTSLSTTFAPLQGAYVTGYSTAPATLLLDVVRPKLSTTLAAGQFQLQIPSSSSFVFSMQVLTYGPNRAPTTNSTALNTAVVGSFVAGSAVVISPGT